MRRDGIDTVIFLVSAVLVFVIFVFVEAWGLMLLVGGVHHEVSNNVPAVGYGGALLLTVALNALVGLFRTR